MNRETAGGESCFGCRAIEQGPQMRSDAPNLVVGVCAHGRQQSAAAVRKGDIERALKHRFGRPRHKLRGDGLDVARIGIRAELGFDPLDQSSDVLQIRDQCFRPFTSCPGHPGATRDPRPRQLGLVSAVIFV